jgi:hypothetical protein
MKPATPALAFMASTLVILSFTHSIARELNLSPELWPRTLAKYVMLSALITLIVVFAVPAATRFALSSSVHGLVAHMVNGLATLIILGMGSIFIGTSSLLKHGGFLAYPFFAEWGFVRFAVLTVPLVSLLAVFYFVWIGRMTGAR